MARIFGFVIFLLSTQLVNADSSICLRESGDQLLVSQPLVRVSLLGQSSNFQKTFPGYRITCVEANLPLGLSSLVNLDVLSGGVGCDSVGLQVKVGRLLIVGVGANVYGIKTNFTESNSLYCNN